MATHQYFTEQLKPSVFSLVDENQSEEYFDPAWMSSTYAIREIEKIYQNLTDKNYSYKEAAIDARSPENEADPVEKDFIQTINRNPDVEKKTLVRSIDGVKYFQLLRKGETMTAECLRCHSTPENAPKEMVEVYGPERSFHREVGEVVSAISIQVPLDYIFEQYNHRLFRTVGFLIGFLLLFISIIYSLNRKLIIKPLSTIVSKTREIAEKPGIQFERDNFAFTKEYKELVESINTMSEQLGSHIEGLDRLVEERTEDLQRAVIEKDYLMRELNHRVKNNLLMVTSLINLKEDELKDSSIDLTDLQHQIDAVRIVHEKLYQSEEISRINFKDYTQDLLETIFTSFSKREVIIENESDDTFIPIKTAISIGLIINELATNAMKHGFSSDVDAHFSLELKKNQEEYILEVSNTGNRFPENINLQNPNTFGLRLITILVEELSGTIELQKGPQTVFTIRFPVPKDD